MSVETKQKSDPGTAPFSRLPDPVLRCILRLLEGVELLTIVERVDQRCLRLSLQGHVWSSAVLDTLIRNREDGEGCHTGWGWSDARNAGHTLLLGSSRLNWLSMLAVELPLGMRMDGLLLQTCLTSLRLWSEQPEIAEQAHPALPDRMAQLQRALPRLTSLDLSYFLALTDPETLSFGSVFCFGWVGAAIEAFTQLRRLALPAVWPDPDAQVLFAES